MSILITPIGLGYYLAGRREVAEVTDRKFDFHRYD
jgi:hypothetical protein